MFTNLKRGWAINLTLNVNFYIKTYNWECFVHDMASWGRCCGRCLISHVYLSVQ